MSGVGLNPRSRCDFPPLGDFRVALSYLSHFALCLSKILMALQTIFLHALAGVGAISISPQTASAAITVFMALPPGRARFGCTRRTSGCCTRCGRFPPEPGLKLCGPCGEKRRAAEKARRARARQQNLPYAGRDPETTRRADRARDRQRRRERRDAGLCTTCGRRRPADGRSVCEPCREEQRAIERQRYAARCAAGRCVRCRQPAFRGSSRCGRCAVLEAERTSPERRKAVNRKRYARRRVQGICVDCSSPAAGSARCPDCARRSNSRAPEPHRLHSRLPHHCRARREFGCGCQSWRAPARIARGWRAARRAELVNDWSESVRCTHATACGEDAAERLGTPPMHCYENCWSRVTIR